MGRIVPDVEFIEGAYPSNPELVFSWLLHRYTEKSQATILAFFKDKGDEDFLLSWPDFSGTPQAFYALIMKVRRAGFRPLVMLTNKDCLMDLDALKAFVAPVLPFLKLAGVPRVCVGWELNSWFIGPNGPATLQAFINWLAPIVRGWGAFLYVHFLSGYGAWPLPGFLFSDFWWANVNKLRGVLFQDIMTQTDQEYQMGEGGIHDILLHFNGGSGSPANSGDGTPFDLVAFEVSLELLGENKITEDRMHQRATVGTLTPPTSGPTGIVRVQGSWCGR